jgi:peroxiredoxin
MTIGVGDSLPSVQLTKLTADGREPVDTAEFFKGRRVALFAVPGAYTPTCSAQHLPGFIQNADALKAKGVDEIACTAVNDPFVLEAWAKANDAQGITMLSDGNADFATALGLDMDGTKFGMGRRSQRYAMVVNDGKVESLHVEAPGEFRVSSADHLLETL